MEEITSIQGSPVQETKSAGGADSSLFISQCFYLTGSQQLAVAISIIEKDSASFGTRSPDDLWKQMFEHGEHEKLEKEEEPRASERVRPEKVDGLGYEAYWLSGALYVRKDRRILRLAVSGSETIESKLSKTKALAQKALSRL